MYGTCYRVVLKVMGRAKDGVGHDEGVCIMNATPKFNGDASAKRLNIVLPDQTMDRINTLKDLTQASSVTDVIKAALLTYEALVEFKLNGNDFYLKQENDNNFLPVKFIFDVKRRSNTNNVVAIHPADKMKGHEAN